MSLFFPLTLAAAAGLAIYAGSGSASSKRIENLQIIGIKGKLEKKSGFFDNLLSQTLSLNIKVHNPNRSQVAIQRMKGEVYYEGKSLGTINYNYNFVIQPGEQKVIPNVNLNVRTFGVVSSVLKALNDNKDQSKDIYLTLKGNIKLDGFSFPLNEKIMLRAGKKEKQTT